jgi:hypothetical protein
MRLLMAPMEGLLDHSLRDTLTRVGGVDRCVSEFIRVTDTLLPARAFERVVPELRHQSRTPAGVPVRPQLLGSDPACMADNAARLAALGAEGVDLNFGCPAKTVNRHRGGAVLLDEPELVHAIVAAVRRAVPAPVPVSAKMRLGFLDDAKALDCALAIEAAGASELVVHARTRAQGYKPPADWDRLAEVRAAVALPVVAWWRTRDWPWPYAAQWRLAPIPRCPGQTSGTCSGITGGKWPCGWPHGIGPGGSSSGCITFGAPTPRQAGPLKSCGPSTTRNCSSAGWTLHQTCRQAATGLSRQRSDGP